MTIRCQRAMAKTRIKSNVKEFQKLLNKATLTGMKRAGLFVHAEARKAVNVPNTGQPRKRTRDTAAGPKGSQYTVYKSPSEPGAAPHTITGMGKSNIVHESNDSEKDPRHRIGSTKAGLYMIMLELGTKHILPRPWLGMQGVLGRFRKQIGMLAVTGAAKRIP